MIQKSERKMYPNITNKCQHATEKMNAKQTKNDEASLVSSFSSSSLLLKYCQPAQLLSAVELCTDLYCVL